MYLNSGKEWRKLAIGKCIADGRLEWLSGRVFLESFSPGRQRGHLCVAIVWDRCASCRLRSSPAWEVRLGRPYFGGLVNRSSPHRPSPSSIRSTNMPSFRGDLILQVLETGHDDRLTLLVKRLQLFARGQRSFGGAPR